MYYPLLRARQFELIALRDLANEGKLGRYITPILEPVKENNSNLNLAHKVFQECDQKVFLIVNPTVGDRNGDETSFLEYIHQDFEECFFTPAFYFHNNSEYIEFCIREFNINTCMIICSNEIEPAEIQALMNLDAVKYINVHDPGRNRSLDRFLKGLDKIYIRHDDLFEKQPRNSDFLEIEEHRFSEEHLYYATENYQGFSDYTVLPSEFSAGGSTPRAVVIHLTYMNPENQIWIRHFTSNSNDSIANVQGKFAEAADKAVTFCREKNLTNSAITELEHYFEKEHYPGLGTVKKISIKNHLLLLHEYLEAHVPMH